LIETVAEATGAEEYLSGFTLYKDGQAIKQGTEVFTTQSGLGDYVTDGGTARFPAEVTAWDEGAVDNEHVPGELADRDESAYAAREHELAMKLEHASTAEERAAVEQELEELYLSDPANRAETYL
jgi:hypothetical protein